MNTLPTILERIIAQKRDDLTYRQQNVPLQSVRVQAEAMPATRGFRAALAQQVAKGHPAVIAELKKASPSKGVIRADYDPKTLASSYARNGATCLSVLTDEVFFQGHDADLRQAREACSLPVLRKDFIIDPYQVYETRALGADCLLLIVAVLHDAHLKDLFQLAQSLGLDVLLEIHNRHDLERALLLEPSWLGINNRDLHSFTVDLQCTLDLLPLLPEGMMVVSESGIHTAADLQRLSAQGVFAFLIGESFMRAPDPGEQLRELLNLFSVA